MIFMAGKLLSAPVTPPMKSLGDAMIYRDWELPHPVKNLRRLLIAFPSKVISRLRPAVERMNVL
jgi:hypothetical protein